MSDRTPEEFATTARPAPDAVGAYSAAGAIDRELGEFLARHPGYGEGGGPEALRRREFSRLDAAGDLYLDYTGAGLYGESQVERHAAILRGGVFGNPHSTNPTSTAAMERVAAARERTLAFFNAPRGEYLVIFTSNASGALKLIGEAYPFDRETLLLLTFDNHNSVNGIREFARAHRAPTRYIPLDATDLRASRRDFETALAEGRGYARKLFAYPAQSNFSGVQHPLSWVARAQAAGFDVVLDAAAFAPTNRLDIASCRPDFVTLSFYKMFGYPTGVGALIARHDALGKLHRPWFAGGTIDVASVQADRYTLASGEAAFEDGTVNYLSIAALEAGFDLLERVGVETIHQRVTALSGWLLQRLSELRHTGGAPLVRLYGPADTTDRGGTIAFNFHDREGIVIGHQRVEEEANRIRLSIRTGCFCNPGAGEIALALRKNQLEGCFNEHESITFEELQACIGGPAGAVRVSLGIATTFADVRRFVEFARGFLDREV
jgi:molybdenum cofactor sulfurtransferase